jgi:hypothetical protein
MKGIVKCWTAINENGNAVQIESARAGDFYKCPSCNMDMFAKRGEVKSHHFAHRISDDESKPHCGGEGYRHLRVKTFLHRILTSVNNRELLFDVIVKCEIKQKEDIPDISVEYKDQIIAYEIVDSNPPSIEKVERWGDRMCVIDISNWSDKEIADTSLLSALLLPNISGYHGFVNSLAMKHHGFKAVIDRMKIQYEGQIEILDEKIENSVDCPPDIWFGSIAKLDRHGRVGEYGFRVVESNSEPLEGDWIIAKTKKGDKFALGVLGELIDEKEFRTKEGKITYSHIYLQKQKRWLENIEDLFPQLRDLVKKVNI